MKLKLAFFLFALGFGMTTTYAMGTSFALCRSVCLKEYRGCLKSGEDQQVCNEERSQCISDCIDSSGM